MICYRSTLEDDGWSGWQEGILAMLPRIRSYLCSAFRSLNPDARAEAVQEGLVNAMAAYRRLWERGKTELVYPSVLAITASRPD